jgi:hypothetical protein
MLGVEGGDPVQQAPLTRNGRRVVLTAAGVSSLGDGMWYAAVPLTAAMINRTPAAVAIVSAAGLLPWLVVAPVAGALVDRWPRRRVLVGADAIRAIIIALLTCALIAGVASIPVLAAGAFLVVSGSIFHGAAQQALIADLTDDDPAGRDKMNGQMSSLEVGGTSLVGPLLARRRTRSPAGSRTSPMRSHSPSRQSAWPHCQPAGATKRGPPKVFASTCVTVTVTSARQRLSPREMLGRVVTAFRTLGNGAAPLGAVAGGAIAASAGLRATLVVAGGLLAAALLLSLPILLRARGSR